MPEHERARSLHPTSQQLEIRSVAEGPVALAAGDLLENAEALEEGDGLGGGRSSGLEQRGDAGDGDERVARELVEQPESGDGSATRAKDVVPVLADLVEEASRGGEGLG